jgi:predicted DNA-binding protein with PD1-like motif
VHYEKLAETPHATYLLVFDIGDEVVTTLAKFALENGLAGSRVEAIGAFQDVTVAWFDWEKQQYMPIPIQEQVEVISLMGNIALFDGKPALHLHIAVAKSDGSAHGGHLLSGHVRPTLEMLVTESPVHLVRAFNKDHFAVIETDTTPPSASRP